MKADYVEAIKLALEALENSIDLVEEDYANAVNLYGKYPSRAQRLIGMETMRDDHRKAITALREALAKQPAPAHCEAGSEYCQQCEAEQEPVEWLTGCPECGMDGGCDCDSGTWNPPAQRTWVGLTEPERLACYDLNPARFASAIEAKLRSKNEDRN